MIKNFIAYNILSSSVNKDSLESSLSAAPFQKCTPMQALSVGWLTQGDDKFYTRNLNQFVKFSFCEESKSVPAGVVNNELQEAIKDFIDRVGAKPNREEKLLLKEEVMNKLLPRAFPKRKITNCWIDFDNNLMFIGAGSYKTGDDVIGFLKKNVRGFDSVSLIHTEVSPPQGMMEWILEDAPANFTVDDQCELVMPTENKPTVKYVRHSLAGDDVANHIRSGRIPVSLSMSYGNLLSFVINEKLIIKSIKPLDQVATQLMDDGVDIEDEVSLQDATFLLTASACSELILGIVDALGGQSADEPEEDDSANEDDE